MTQCCLLVSNLCRPSDSFFFDTWSQWKRFFFPATRYRFFPSWLQYTGALERGVANIQSHLFTASRMCFQPGAILPQSAIDFASHLHITLGNRKKCLVLGKVACLKSWKMLWSMRWRFLLQQGSKWTFSSNCTIPMSYGLLQASCGLLAYASVFHICRSYFEYLDVAFPSVIASLPNANALSAPYPAFQKLCCISLNVPNILEHWSLGVELEFVAIIASRSIFLRFSNEGHRRSLSTTPTGNLKQSTSGIFYICVSLDEVLYFLERTKMISWQGRLCCNSAFEEV